MRHVTWLLVSLLLVTPLPCCGGGKGHQLHKHRSKHSPLDYLLGKKRLLTRAAPKGPPPARDSEYGFGCPSDCELHVLNLAEIRSTFLDLVEEWDTTIVLFRIIFPEQNDSALENEPYMKNNFRSFEWIWASERLGRRRLGLPIDADVLSFYILSQSRYLINVNLAPVGAACLWLHSPACRLLAVRKLIIFNLTHSERHKNHRDFICHQIIDGSNSTDLDPDYSHLVYRCCDTSAFRAGDHSCNDYATYHQQTVTMQYLIYTIAFVFTLFSPVFILKIKMLLKYDSITKFFRASLKHGITGQRNYVIRISSRQLINLADPKPFSIPRFVFRLIFHCYGEGRCCIHWWGDWSHQPNVCHRAHPCHRCWLLFWRCLAVVCLYPILIYIAIVLYAPQLAFYQSLLEFAQQLKDIQPLHLNINIMGWALLPNQSPAWSFWMMFSIAAFIYTALLLSWQNNPLERCLLHSDTRRPHERTRMLYGKMTRSYKGILQKLAYGDYKTKRHFFRIRWLPWGLRRCLYFCIRTLLQIPIINICFSLHLLDQKVFNFKEQEDNIDRDVNEMSRKIEARYPSPWTVCKVLCAIILWLLFVFILTGYGTAVFVMTSFAINVMFFTLLGAVLHATTILPWICCTLVLLYYFNDTLTHINKEHKEILKLIDENSPRISAVEDPEEIFREGTIQILGTHNLGAVKFIDGDNTEYVSKELYYNVCADLKCGWSNSLRRLLVRFTIVTLYVVFVFVSLFTIGNLIGSGLLLTLIAIVLSSIPKVMQWYINGDSALDERRALWVKIMPDILDRHIRVDRGACVDVEEQELTTYDVRPVGVLELDIPKVIHQRSLSLWKFPWIVSADQQTQSHEGFILALANKLAAAAFLSKLVTRDYSSELEDVAILRQWCLLVETCILEGSTTASSINGVPVESLQLFPRDIQPLVSTFEPGSTIDSAVDSINRELYGPYTKGVLVTIGNTTIAMCKMDSTICAFNSSCHGDQVTDLFGAVLIATDFNTQNLQTTIKYLVDPYAPDAVPVYSIVPIEGFVFRSADIMHLSDDA